ncbi:MAG: gfo/Idh/MocA family oxidoreductase, partial [Actinobacteria bacterium]|nr:gfo/Idh/MocA family oxidoreductase [Actinomycetota bacterium]
MADVEKMRQAEARYPRQKLMFGFNHRHHPAVQEAKAICEAGELGRILWLRGLYGKSGGTGFENSWRNDPEISGGGILIDQGIHMLDLCRYFLGELSEVEGWLGTHFWKIPVEDNAFVHLRNQSGQVAQVHSSATLWKHTFQMDLGLEEGYLSIRGLLSKTGSYGRETLVVGRKVGTTGRGAAGNPPEEVIYYDRDDSWKVQMESFLACIREDKPVPESTSDDALRLMELIEKVYRIGKAKRIYGGLTPQVRPPEVHTVIDTPRMRQSVVDAEIRESEVWPEKLLSQYRRMVSQDARRIYAKKTNLRVVACPACGSRKASLRFELEGAKYRTCEACGTWYVSPRPTPT